MFVLGSRAPKSQRKCQRGRCGGKHLSVFSTLLCCRFCVTRVATGWLGNFLYSIIPKEHSVWRYFLEIKDSSTPAFDTLFHNNEIKLHSLSSYGLCVPRMKRNTSIRTGNFSIGVKKTATVRKERVKKRKLLYGASLAYSVVSRTFTASVGTEEKVHRGVQNVAGDKTRLGRRRQRTFLDMQSTRAPPALCNAILLCTGNPCLTMNTKQLMSI